MQELYTRLKAEVEEIGIEQDYELVLKRYSKSFFGRYDTSSKRVILYVFEDKECTRMFSFEKLLCTLIHELIHCIQWNDPDYVRYKGVMHDAEFHKLYHYYSRLARARLLLKEMKTNRTLSKEDIQGVCCFDFVSCEDN